VTVTATATESDDGPGFRRLVYYLDGSYLLTDYQSPYTFTIPTAKFVDGAKTLSVEAWMRDGLTSGRAAINLQFSNGVTTPPVNTNSRGAVQGTNPAAGQPFVVAVTGDGAGGDTAETDVTNLVAGWNPNMMLYLGDVYENGSPTEFYNWYRPQAQAGTFYGRFNSITNPVIGNHEYNMLRDGTAPGYFDYWDNIPHYYSYNAHGWHFIALDSTGFFRQTSTDSAQYQWLENDLKSVETGSATTVGKTTAGANVAQVPADTKFGNKVTLNAGSLSKVSAYLDARGRAPGGQQAVRALVYADASGNPGALKASSGEVIIPKNNPAGWVDFTFSPAVNVAAGSYWIVLQAGANSNIVRAYSDSATGAGRTNADTYANGASDPFGPATVTDSAWSINATYTPTTALPCTIAYWHEPLYNVGDEGPQTSMQNIWALLAQHGVDLVLNGHDHNYQRWVPLDGNGNPDPAGVTEFVSGAGGHALSDFTGTDSRVAARYNADYGALRLELNAGGAGYRFITRAGSTVDSGTVQCQPNVADSTPPTDPAGLTATGSYKTTVDLAWTAAVDDVGVSAYEIYRDGNLLTTIGSQTTYSDTTVEPGTTHDYKVRARDAAGHTSGFSNIASATTPTVAVLFHDGFESGDLSKWTNPAQTTSPPNAGLTAQQANVFAGSWAVRSQSDGSAGAAASKLVAPPGEANLYYEARFKVLSQGANVNLLRFRNGTIGANAIATVYVSTGNKIGIRNDVAGVATTSLDAAGAAAPGAWHTVQAHVLIDGTSSKTEVWLDGKAVPDLTLTGINLGSEPVGRVDLGGTDLGKTFDVALDEVAYDREYMADSGPPTDPTGLSAVATSKTSADLSWNASSDDVAVEGYDIYRDGNLLTSVGATTTYSDSGLVAASTHSYQVKAKDAAGNVSGFSNTASVTTPASGVLFSDGFETGNLSKWTNPAPATNPANNGLTVQQSNVFAGSWAARAQSSGAAGAAATRTLSSPQAGLYYEARFKVLSQSANVNLLRFRDNTTAADAIATVFVSSTGKIGIRNDVTGVSTTSAVPAGAAPSGAWHTVQAHVVVGGGTGQTEVWVDGSAVSDLNQSGINLGTAPIARLDLGDLNSATSPRSFDVALDDVAYDAEYMPDTAAPSAPTNLAVTSPSGFQVNLTWTPATDDVAVTGYDIYRNDQPLTSVGAVSSYQDTTAAAATSYTYKVRAKDAAGNSSQFSNTAGITTGDVFADDFESGGLTKWTSVSGLAAQNTDVDTGQWAARSTSSGGAGASAQVTLGGTANELYYRVRFKIVSQTTNVNLIRFKTAANAAIATVFVSLGTPPGKLAYRNDVTGVTTTSGTAVPAGGWHELELHANVSGGLLDVVLDGASVITASGVNLGSNPIGRLELGETTSGRTFNVVFDNVVADPTSIAGSGGPGSPANLHTTAATGTHVDLAWDPPSTTLGISGYRIYRNGSQIASLGSSSLSYSDTAVSDATQYTYGVSAIDSAAHESAQSTLQVTTPDTTKPSKPGGLSAAPVAGAKRVDLSWNASTDNVGVTSYRIYRNGAQIDSVNGTTLAYADLTVTGPATYSYTVSALDAAANESPQSDAASATVGDVDAPSAPGNLRTTSVSAGAVALAWNASTDNVGVDGYVVYRDGALLASLGSAALAYTDDTVADASSYTYTVKAVDAVGNASSASNALQVATPPKAPTGLSAVPVAGQKKVVVSWTASTSTGVTGYTVYRGGTNVGQVSGATVSYDDTTVSGPATYTYTVTATANGVESAASSAATATTGDLEDPTPPTVSATAVSASQINLSWSGATDNVGVTGYQIFRDGSQVTSVNGSTNTYSDTGLTAGSTYAYTVKALDAAGRVSAASAPASATTGAPPVFTDDFETGNLSRWTSVTGLIVQNVSFSSGSWAAEAKSNKNTAAFAVKQLPSTYADLYYRLRLNILSGKPDTVDVMTLRTAAGTPLLSVFYDSKRNLSYRNETNGTSTTSTTTLSQGQWYEVKVHLSGSSGSGQVEIWLNGTKVAALSKSDSFGTNPIGQIVAGEIQTGHAYDYAIDDVVVDTKP
jgi:fibronectin type 3 domain-containing protein